MVSKDENVRPTASKIIGHQYLRSNSVFKSRSQLYKELEDTKARIKQLELELKAKAAAESSPWLPTKLAESSSPRALLVARPKPFISQLSSSRLLVGRGTSKSHSCLV